VDCLRRLNNEKKASSKREGKTLEPAVNTKGRKLVYNRRGQGVSNWGWKGWLDQSSAGRVVTPEKVEWTWQGVERTQGSGGNWVANSQDLATKTKKVKGDRSNLKEKKSPALTKENRREQDPGSMECTRWRRDH